MTENEEIKTMDNSFMSSKFGKLFMTIIAVFLVFAGPTYVIYGLAVIIKVDLAASFVVGFVLFVIGLVHDAVSAAKENHFLTFFASDTPGCIIKSAFKYSSSAISKPCGIY